MNRKTIALSSILWMTLFLFAACKKPDSGNNDNRKVKYEITGNFTGTLTVIVNDNDSGNTVFSNVSLPWTLEKTYAGNVTGIGIGGNSANPGAATQTLNVKIYAGATVVKNSSATADVNGVISVPTQTYLF